MPATAPGPAAAVGAGVSDRSHEHVAAAVKTIGRTHENYANLGTVHVACGADYDHRNPHAIKFSWRKLWLYTGPGLLVSMAYLDPGNLTSDLQQGAYTQYQLLWVLWWSTVAGWILQVLSARIGVVTGKDLAQVCREEMPRWAVINLFIQMELAIIGADIQEVLAPPSPSRSSSACRSGAAASSPPSPPSRFWPSSDTACGCSRRSSPASSA